MIEYTTPEIFLHTADAQGEVDPLIPKHSVQPTQEFMDALVEPEFIGIDGVTHAVYTFNRRMIDQRRPLLLVRPIAGGVAGRKNSTWWNAVTPVLERPVIAVELPGNGLSDNPKLDTSHTISEDSIAKSIVQILDKIELETDDIDLAGFCFGGLIAAKVAVKLGERAHNLITFATPGFNNDLLRRIATAGGKTLALVMADVVDMEYHFSDIGAIGEDTNLLTRLATTGSYMIGSWLTSKLNRARSGHVDGLDTPKSVTPLNNLPKLHRVRLTNELVQAEICFSANRAPMQSMPVGLDSQTHWADIVGTSDDFTGYTDHIPVCERRNNLVPGSTSLTLITGARHNLFYQANIPYVATDIEKRLQEIS